MDGSRRRLAVDVPGKGRRCRSHGVLTPGRGAVVVYRGAAEVARKLAFAAPRPGPVEHAPVVPNDHVSWLDPRHAEGIFVLRGVLLEQRQELLGPLWRDAAALEVVQ